MFTDCQGRPWRGGGQGPTAYDRSGMSPPSTLRAARVAAVLLSGLAVAVAALGCRFVGSGACARSAACVEEGKCGTRTTRAGDGGVACYPDSEDSCARSTACKERGACRLDRDFDPRRCVARTSTDCLESARCRRDGECTLADDGSCVASVAGCSRSEACRARGACTPRMPFDFGPATRDAVVVHTQGDACVAGPLDPTCEAACRDEGACTRTPDGCVAVDSAACRASRLCAAKGRCSVDPVTRTCVARSTEDCKASDGCRRAGRDRWACAATRGHDACVDETSWCGRDDMCVLRGDCQAKEGICVPASDADCKRSIQCAVRGACTAVSTVCAAGGPADCAGSIECRLHGRCDHLGLPFAKGGLCGKKGEPPPPELACAREPCLDDGRCLYVGERECRTPAEEHVDDTLPRRRLPRPSDRRTVDGEVFGRPRTYASAVAILDGQAASVVLSQEPPSCERAKTYAGRLAADAVVVNVQLDTRGELAPRILSVSSTPPGTSHARFGVPAASRVTTTRDLGQEGATTWVGLDVDTRSEHGTISLHGRVEVRGCGARAR